jgi:putative membrane protein
LAGVADPRILQANERTLLAWVRTSIALMTFGFVIARLGVWLRTIGGQTGAAEERELGTAWIGAVFVVMGVLGNAAAVVRYAANRRAIRRGEEIKEGSLPVALATMVTVFGAIIGAYLLLRLR